MNKVCSPISENIEKMCHYFFSTLIYTDRKNILMIQEKCQILIIFVLNALYHLKIPIRISIYFEIAFKFSLLKPYLLSVVP